MRKNITISTSTDEKIKELIKLYTKKFEGSRVTQGWLIGQAIDLLYSKEKKIDEED